MNNLLRDDNKRTDWGKGSSFPQAQKCDSSRASDSYPMDVRDGCDRRPVLAAAALRELGSGEVK
jgi:hypothetical protein